jgi:hypothetical protein
MTSAFLHSLSTSRQGHVWSPRAIAAAVVGCLKNQLTIAERRYGADPRTRHGGTAVRGC